MKIRHSIGIACSLLGMSAFTVDLAAQTSYKKGDKPEPRGEIVLQYDYIHSNTLPAGCGCFNLNGGSGQFAWRILPQKVAAVGDISITHGSASSTYSLTLSTFMFGLSYEPELWKWPVRPFGQALIGVAHSSGSLVATGVPATNAGAAFAASGGGGLDWPVRRHFSVRAIEADYLLTRINNAVNDHQNNLRISTGVILRF